MTTRNLLLKVNFIIPLCIAGEKKEKNIGLDFPISIENWLNTIVQVRVDMVLGPVCKEGGGGNPVVLT